MKSTNNSTPTVVGALAIALIVSAAAYVMTQSGANNTGSLATNTATATKETTSQTTDTAASTASSSQAAADTTTSTDSASSTNRYKDGTYTASADYSVPHGNNSIKVSLTVKNGVVASVSSSHDYADHESGMYVDWFDAAIDNFVVGKSLGDISLNRVGGASLTTYGFDDALATIANQAKA